MAAEETGKAAVADRERRQGPVSRDLLMLFLALVSIAILIYDETTNIPQDERQALIVIDAFIVLVFAIEFVYGLWTAQDKRAYWKSHWWELPGLVPMAVGEASFLRAFRLARAARVIRIIRVISVLARLRRANAKARGFISRSHLATVLAVAGMLIVTCAYLEFLAEKDANPGQFGSFWDALWWAIVTTTTVGYGDKFPLTTEGRLVAIVLMFTGIGIIGALAGSLANALLKTPGGGGPRPLEERLKELSDLHAAGKLTDDEFGRAKAKVLSEG